MRRTVYHIMQIACMACVLSLCIEASGQELPRWVFSAGDKANYRFSSEAELRQGGEAEPKLLATVHQQIDYAWEISDVAENGSATVDIEVRNFQLKVLGPGGKEVEFGIDSSNEPQGFAAMLLPLGKQLRQGRLQFQMTPASEVNFGEMPENLSQAVKSIPGGETYSTDGGAASFANLGRLGGWGFPLESDEQGVWREPVPVPESPKTPFAVAFQYRKVEPGENGITQIEKKMLLEPTADSAMEIVEQESGGEISFDENLGRPILAEHSLRAVLQPTDSSAERVVVKLKAKYEQLSGETEQ